jgi:hypothetical protein
MSFSEEKNGWLYIHIEGKPYERGVQHGEAVADILKTAIETTKFYCEYDYGKSWDFFVKESTKIFKPVIKKNYPEIFDEMVGISEGCKKKGFDITIDEVICWNASLVIFDYWWPNEEAGKVLPAGSRTAGGANGPRNVSPNGALGRCSAFIAVGKDYTQDGKIVLAHNTFENFVSGQFCNIMLSIKPDKGSHILMQTQPGFVWSGSDFFITKNDEKKTNFVGSETTIGGFMPYKLGNPIFCRIRQAMQYAEKLEDFETELLKGNTGGYANSWIFGDVNENKIMRIELGLKYHTTEYKNDGYFIGFNGSYDPQIRNLECKAQGFNDIRRHQGARHVRLEQLIDEHKGKINIDIAKKILSDHYDVYLKKINPCSRTIDSHYEMDDRAFMSQADRPKPFQPRGAVDGKCVDSLLAKDMKLWGKWGSSGDIPFEPDQFFKDHPIWVYLKPYLLARPTQEWTLFPIEDEKKSTIVPLKKSLKKSLKKWKKGGKNKTKKKR